MNGDESFLARWSRRKHGAAARRRDNPKPETAVSGAASQASATSVPADEPKPRIDPVSLPPIGSIGAGSGIRAFLAAGVPADLTRAALRRAWSSDPAIRDFVGLSENSWDFNATEAIPGFGSIGKEQIQRLVQRVMGEPVATATTPPPSVATSGGDQGPTHTERNPT
jgi:hypothetical protein